MKYQALFSLNFCFKKSKLSSAAVVISALWANLVVDIDYTRELFSGIVCILFTLFYEITSSFV